MVRFENVQSDETYLDNDLLQSGKWILEAENYCKKEQ